LTPDTLTGWRGQNEVGQRAGMSLELSSPCVAIAFHQPKPTLGSTLDVVVQKGEEFGLEPRCSVHSLAGRRAGETIRPNPVTDQLAG
jgi:hypothetical protein